MPLSVGIPREVKTDEHRVIAVKTGGERRVIDVKPLRRHGRHDDGQDATKHDLGCAADVRRPRNAEQKKRPAQRIVLEHHLSDAAQVDIEEP